MCIKLKTREKFISESGKAVMDYTDRINDRIVQENVYAGRLLRIMYGTKAGGLLNELIFKRRWFNRLLGWYWDSGISRRQIQAFIKKYCIPMEEYTVPAGGFKSFNSFFTRSFREGKRPFRSENSVLCSPVEGKLIARVGIGENDTLLVKGTALPLTKVFPCDLKEFRGSTVLVFRLYLGDYHRFHFFDSGIAKEPVSIPGFYYSVSPMHFLKKSTKFYSRNHRQVTVFESDQAGKVMMCEVGGFCVGTIAQTFAPGLPVERGSEKGYFKFGGSTVLLLFQKGRVSIDPDIISNSKRDMETAVLLGTRIGTFL